MTTPTVSVISPCRKGGGQLQLLAVDGVSTDRTRTIVSAFAVRHPNARLLRNPHRATPRSLDVGMVEARGAANMRLDTHSTYAPRRF